MACHCCAISSTLAWCLAGDDRRCGKGGGGGCGGCILGRGCGGCLGRAVAAVKSREAGGWYGLVLGA